MLAAWLSINNPQKPLSEEKSVNTKQRVTIAVKSKPEILAISWFATHYLRAQQI